jgi:hypothetical protein
LVHNPIKPLGTLEEPNGEHTATGKETLEILFKAHFPGCFLSEDISGSFTHNWERPWLWASQENWKLAGRIIAVSNIKWAINKFGPYKSSGGDGIFPALLQKGPNPLYPILCELFRARIVYSYIPEAWKINRVAFIPKHGHQSFTDAKSFLPISLSSFLRKTMESLVQRYIREGILHEEPLHRNQHAYQEGNSCKTALYQLVSKIEDSLASKEIALCTFLDIEGAFDNTSYESII